MVDGAVVRWARANGWGRGLLVVGAVVGGVEVVVVSGPADTTITTVTDWGSTLRPAGGSVRMTRPRGTSLLNSSV